MNTIYIKHLPKDKLLYNLWLKAKTAKYMNKPINLTLDQVKTDINFMIKNHREIELTTYHGKSLFVNITHDHLDPFTYTQFNGDDIVQSIITNMKKQELKKSICKYYIT